MNDRTHSRVYARTYASVGAVVLAAGRSSRMGTLKQLLTVGGSTALERTLAAILAAGVDQTVLVLGFAADEIQRQLSPGLLEGINVVMNQEYASGMASSLRAGLSAFGEQMQAALIVLADQPLVRTATVDRIVERYRATHADIVIPHYQGKRGNPVLLNRAVFPEAMALEGDTGCRAIFGSHANRIVQVDVDDPGILQDMDTPEDYERLRETL